MTTPHPHADLLRAKLIECRAAQLRTREWQAQHRQATACVRRLDPATGQWRTQRVAGAWVKACRVGSASNGVVFKDYEVTT